jgi:predicted ribosomally synthesized peptide with SipW-like signal peptide
MSVLAIIICIVALSSSTWALFSDVTPSQMNKITAAGSCSLEVSVSDSNNINVAISDVKTPSTVALKRGEVYTVNLSLPAESSSGYLKISYNVADDSVVEYTSDYILRHKDDVPHTLTFSLKVSEDITSESIEVTFTTRWGTHSVSDAIHDGGSVEIK